MDAIKDAAGFPRPDFFWRCFPDRKDVYDQLGNVICHGTEKDIKEGHKTFPSGHASWSFVGLGFLSLYLSGKIRVFDGRGLVARLCLIGLPLVVATLVSISLVDDYYHRGLDVFIGGLIGLIADVCCYLHFFPPPYKKNGWVPREYFRRLEELHAGSTQQATNAVNALNGQGIDAQAFRSIQAEGINNQYNRGLLEVHNPSLDEKELGRR
ncbi:hypothetical protein GIB67_004880 [Kingdonia uniflora]|uniref:Phosphatidic acid phosphatase type 2/haloperoxidase domain-containing protein n=1 Tax=Kingdonia uniflora TaxID=39325 RepID=A0A7J7LNI4_9MAGN|nr:hypothetical protein GIB67_004880 [Kingdonia uniflora]